MIAWYSLNIYKCYIYITSNDAELYKARLQNCRLRTISLDHRIGFNDRTMSMILRKELTKITSKLNNAMDELSTPVLVSRIEKQFYSAIDYEQEVCAEHDAQEQQRPSSVTLANLSGPLVMIVGIGFIACGIVILEISFHKPNVVYFLNFLNSLSSRVLHIQYVYH